MQTIFNTERSRTPMNGVAVPPAQSVGVVSPPPRVPTAAKGVARLAEITAGVFALLQLAVAMRFTPGGHGEGYGVARVLAAAPTLGGDLAEAEVAWPERVFSPMVAGWITLTGGLNRYDTALAAVREPMLPAAALMVLLAWMLASRLGLATPARIAVLMLAAGTGAAATMLAGGVRPGIAAAVAVVLSTVLVTGRDTGSTARIIALLATAAGVALAPAILPALLVALAVLLAQGDLASGIAVGTRRMLAWCCTLLAAGAIVVIAQAPDWLFPPTAAPLPQPSVIESALAAVALLLTLTATARRWLRPPALGVLVLLGTAAIAPTGSQGDLLAVALPVISVVSVAAADDAASRLRWLKARRPTWATVPTAVTAVCVLVASAVLVVNGAGPVPAVPDTRAVAAWATQELAGSQVLLVDDTLLPELLRAGLPPQRMRTDTGLGAASGPDAADPAWRMVTGTAAEATATDAWRTYASFGTGDQQVIVLGRASASGETGDLAQRTSAGELLAGNPHLVAAPTAALALRRGDVELRLMLILGELLGQHELAISDFPVVAGEQPGDPPLRRVLITTVNGRPAQNPAITELLTTWFDRQLGVFRPRAVEPVADGLLVRYALTGS
ncbi:hypothetical protein AB0B31_11400 [Catellatospora citrea]|uniref:hypothetical protein n=1 Tax=Catellatospora citrea TaxID=53366 RepID=UPI0033D0283D